LFLEACGNAVPSATPGLFCSRAGANHAAIFEAATHVRRAGGLRRESPQYGTIILMNL